MRVSIDGIVVTRQAQIDLPVDQELRVLTTVRRVARGAFGDVGVLELALEHPTLVTGHARLGAAFTDEQGLCASRVRLMAAQAGIPAGQRSVRDWQRCVSFVLRVTRRAEGYTGGLQLAPSCVTGITASVPVGRVLEVVRQVCVAAPVRIMATGAAPAAYREPPVFRLEARRGRVVALRAEFALVGSEDGTSLADMRIVTLQTTPLACGLMGMGPLAALGFVTMAVGAQSGYALGQDAGYFSPVASVAGLTITRCDGAVDIGRFGPRDTLCQIRVTLRTTCKP